MPPMPINEAYTNRKNSALGSPSGKPLSLLEKVFSDADANTVSFHRFISELLHTPYWLGQAYPKNQFPPLCIGLSSHIDKYTQSLKLGEPAYHSRKHFRDVCLSLTLLLDQTFDVPQSSSKSKLWEVSPEDAWLLLFCAIGHDYGHTGSINTKPLELENRSLELIMGYLQTSGLQHEEIQNLMNAVEPIILATDPSSFTALISKFISTTPNFTKTDCLSMLMVESDLLASALPNHGVILSQRLSQEWEVTNPKGALAVASKEGRVKFLEFIRFISPYAIMLGMEDIRQYSIEQLKA